MPQNDLIDYRFTAGSKSNLCTGLHNFIYGVGEVYIVWVGKGV